MLDAIRYLVVWNPLLLGGLHFALRMVGFGGAAGGLQASSVATNATAGFQLAAANASGIAEA